MVMLIKIMNIKQLFYLNKFLFIYIKQRKSVPILKANVCEMINKN